MILSKKIRLLWQEKMDPGYTTIIPQISFDRGKDWINLQNFAGDARTNTKKYLSSKLLDNGYREVDITLALCPKIVPEIKSIEITPNPNGFPIGTWYFGVCALTYDTPGFDDNITNNYFSGPISKIKSVTLTKPSSIDLYVKYPEYTKGLAIYWGQMNNGTLTLKLYHITNLVQKLKESVVTASTVIKLANKYPFPTKGTVKIGNEYIDYTNCIWNTDHWELTGITRGRRDSIIQDHIVNQNDDIEVYLSNYTGGVYGEIPARNYFKPSIPSNLKYYLNFDSGSVVNLAADNTSSQAPEIIGSIEYTSDFALMGKTLKLTGAGIIKTNISLNTITNTGTIHLLHAYVDSISNSNPYIFGSSIGLWMAIDKTNLKPILGYNNMIIIPSNDPRTPALSKLDLDQIMLSWQPILNNKINFKLYINKNLVADVDADINPTTFMPDISYIGGLYNNNTITNTYIGYIDEFRIYNTALSLNDCSVILNEILNSDSNYCGLVPIVSNTHYYDLSVVNNSININLYEPLFDKSITVTDPATYGNDYSITLDNWIIDHFYTDQSIPNNQHLTYPIDPESVKIRFEMSSDLQGFKTPEIKNISTIISEVSLS